MRLWIAAALVALPLQAHAQLDVKCAGWAIDRDIIDRRSEVIDKMIAWVEAAPEGPSERDIALSKHLRASQIFTERDFAETQRLYDEICG